MCKVLGHHDISSVILSEVPAIQRIKDKAIVSYHVIQAVTLVVWVQGVPKPLPTSCVTWEMKGKTELGWRLRKELPF